MLGKIVFLSVLSVILATEKVRYDNFALYNVKPQNEDHLGFLQELHNNPQGLRFWSAPSRVGEYVSVVSPPKMRTKFERLLKKNNIPSELKTENIQEAFDAQVSSRKKRSVVDELFFTNYQTLEDLYSWFDYLAQTYPSVVTVIQAGESHEGRNITGIKISRRATNRAILLEGGEVAADWLSPTVIAYIADQLVRGTDPEARAASEDFEWHIIPMINVDGHEYTNNVDRLWMKNLRPINNADTGVDIVRNWNSQWGVRGGSYIASADNYWGLGPFSEIETRSVSRYIESIGTRLVGSLSFRQYGQKLLIPFAHSAEPMYNYDEMLTIGRRAMGSLSVKYNTQYLVDTSFNIHDGSTGMMADWVKHRFNPPVVATFQLRDFGTETGGWGYTLPVVQVQPTCEETFDAVMAIIREAKFINVL